MRSDTSGSASLLADPEVSERTEQLLQRVRWESVVFQRDGTSLLHMAYNPDRDGAYAGDADGDGLISAWNMTAEQLCLYLLAAGHPDIDASLAQALYAGFDRPIGRWGGEPFVHAPGGPLFVYQFSHAWLPFQRYRDASGFDWFENSVRAIRANRAWCIDHHAQFRTLGPHLWGLTAGDGVGGYIVSGAPVEREAGCTPYCEGTVMAYGMVASLPFLPEVASESLLWLSSHHPGMWGPYGLADAINLEGPRPRYITTCLGIDKGPAVVMADNHLRSTTWDAYEQHPWIARAVQRLGWTRVAPTQPLR